MNIYVGNISHQSTEDELRQAFGTFGKVDTVNIVKDRFSGQSRGFGFIEMPVQSEAEAAIGGLNGKELGGRTLTVNPSKPKTDGGNRGGGFRR